MKLDRDLIRINPRKVLEENPVAQIPNPVTISLLSAGFAPSLLGHPVVAWVNVRDINPRLSLVDGMNRTYFIANYPSLVLANNPDFDVNEIWATNGTEAFLKNGKIVLPGEKQGEKVLSIEQYLRAIIPPTKKQAEIITDRIAAHLVNAWDILVGSGISERFSAVAALGLLSRSYFGRFDEGDLRKLLSIREQFIEGETVDDNATMVAGIVQIARIISESDLKIGDVAETAFMLVGEGGEIIGGSDESKKQVYGLLHTPTVEDKLRDEFKRVGQRERGREELGDAILVAYRRVASHPERQQALVNIHESLENNKLPFKATLDVLRAHDPGTAYHETWGRKNAQDLEEFYRRTLRKKRPLSQVESGLLTQIGGQTAFADRMTAGRMLTIVRIIQQASAVVDKQALPLLALLESMWGNDDLEKNAIMLRNSIANLSHPTPEIVSRRVRDLQALIADVKLRSVKTSSSATPTRGRVRSIHAEDRRKARRLPPVVLEPSAEELVELSDKNSRFSAAADAFLKVLDEIALAPDEARGISRDKGREILRRTGRIVYGHPDITTLFSDHVNKPK